MRAVAFLAAALALAACTTPVEGPARGPAGQPFAVSAITVEAGLPVVRSREAAAYWQGLPPDLETAIAQEFIGEIAPDGRAIVVRIDEMAIATSQTAGLGAEDARLAGRVDVVDRASGRVLANYELTARAIEALGEGDGAISTRTSTDFYLAVVRAFARGVAETVRAGA